MCLGCITCPYLRHGFIFPCLAYVSSSSFRVLCMFSSIPAKGTFVMMSIHSRWQYIKNWQICQQNWLFFHSHTFLIYSSTNMTYQLFSDHFNHAPMSPSKDAAEDKGNDSYFSITSDAKTDASAATPAQSEPPSVINAHIGNLIQEEKERYHKSTDNLHVSL